ncbi:MAG TPA: phosphoglycerate kinase [Candidatus Saccharimonadales bacterium]|nr:phosphoglycerate kinase [Candidatus Saccharimonadales bacterium]
MGNFNKKTVKDINLSGKRVLLRTDYNVPDIGSDFRIRQSMPTIEYILSQKPEVLIIISHLGRPDGAEKKYSLHPIAEHLGKLLKRRVFFIDNCTGQDAKDAAGRLNSGSMAVMENLRFHAGEEQNSPEFAKELIDTAGAEVFVQDGFGVVHRAHASTDAITKLLPSVSGLLLQKEAETITRVMKDPDHPLVAVIGGAKIADKLEVMKRLVKLADCVAVGGAMANNFLKIKRIGIGNSLFDAEGLDMAQDVLEQAEAKSRTQPFSFLLPVDAVVSESIDGRKPTRIVDFASHTIADIEAYPRLPKPDSYTVGKYEAICDIGPVSAARIAGVIGMAKTVIWNGTLGIAEVKGIAGAHAPFGHGSRIVAESMAGPHNSHPSKPFSLIGGGDTSAFVEDAGLTDDFDHVSTGGGASLELMAGKRLPGIEALEDKK